MRFKQWFTLLTDCGTGKSTLVRKLSLSSSDFQVLYLSDSQLKPYHFYHGLLEQLGVTGRYYRGDAKRLLHQEVEILGESGFTPVVT